MGDCRVMYECIRHGSYRGPERERGYGSCTVKRGGFERSTWLIELTIRDMDSLRDRELPGTVPYGRLDM